MTVLVVGAGVVGLAIGRALALRDHDVIVADAADGIGAGISSRNSEVIHGGMYYPTESRKARHCVRGRRMLYAFCESHGVPVRKCGKLIVATSPNEQTKIEDIVKQGHANDVEGLQWLDARQVHRLEPLVSCVGALHSPETGIIDSHSYMLALQGDLEDHGGAVALQNTVDRLRFQNGNWQVRLAGEPAEITCDMIVNAAGLGAVALADRIDGYPSHRIPTLYLAKGSYFGYSGRSPFRHLIYPAPVDGGLGVHLTMDLADRIKFGPDVEWIEEIDYQVASDRRSHFVQSAARYWPGVNPEMLFPDYAGIRPKLAGPNQPAADFRIDGPDVHHLPRLVNLFGIESPGLTSSLSIADEVAGMLDS